MGNVFNLVAPSNINLPPTLKTLEESTWTEIRELSDEGLASECWAVGDRKAITTTNGATLYAYVLGFNHNAFYEGGNRTHFALAFDSETDGNPLAFIEHYMNDTAINTGGWASSSMRNVILPEIKTLLPSDLQTAIKSVIKYTDNGGGGTDKVNNVTPAIDQLFLLSEYEVFGERYYANSAEQTYQRQYDYFANGGEKIMWGYDLTVPQASGSKIAWWMRSPFSVNASDFCNVGTDGNIGYANANTTIGFVPCFCV